MSVKILEMSYEFYSYIYSYKNSLVNIVYNLENHAKISEIVTQNLNRKSRLNDSLTQSALLFS